MRQSPIARFACTGAVALAAIAGVIPPADAAVYRGRFTPDYGDPFPALYWNGTIEVSAPDACIPASPGSVSLLSCQGMEITEATVNLYNKDDYDLDNSTAPLVTLDFGAVGWNGLNWLLTFGENGMLVGATSTAFPAIKASDDDSETKYNGEPAYFSLQFLGNYAQLYWFENEPTAAELLLLTDITKACRENGETVIRPIWVLGYDGNTCGWSDPDNINSALGAFITFERVPEPATLALVPAALGLMGFGSVLAKRRRRLLMA
jgi:hypothetical protein